ncbi:MAG: hypothetical protein ABI273_15100 [Lacunisphaera sp.]
MNKFDQQWQKLTALARQAHDPRDTAMPYGFATRVMARPVATPFSLSSVMFGRFAVRGLLVAAAFGLAAIAVDYSTYVTSTQTDAVVAADMVGDMIDPS